MEPRHTQPAGAGETENPMKDFRILAVVLLFALMAIVLIIRPWGLLGRPEQ